MTRNAPHIDGFLFPSNNIDARTACKMATCYVIASLQLHILANQATYTTFKL